MVAEYTVVVQRTFQISCHCSASSDTETQRLASRVYRVPLSVLIIIVIRKIAFSISATCMIECRNFGTALQSGVPCIP